VGVVCVSAFVWCACVRDVCVVWYVCECVCV